MNTEMKNLLSLFLLILPAMAGKAQNIQLHYDMGKDRNYLTSTVEMFRPDKLGSTFFFIDMDYGAGGAKGVTMAYWEIARSLKYRDFPVAFHTEYNGGMGQDPDGMAFQIENSYLNGIEYSLDAEDFSRGFTLQALHKVIQGKHNDAFQLTGVWYLTLLKGKILFTGFADFWREDFEWEGSGTRYVFQSEPQLWLNLSKHFSIGGEVELGHNFAYHKGWKACPTLGLKYQF